MNINNLATIIFTLASIAILSLDLGIDFNSNEIKVYKHPYFQILAVLSGIYLNVNDFRSGFLVFTLWVIMKYFKIKSI